jgi:hypothetical protein
MGQKIMTSMVLVRSIFAVLLLATATLSTGQAEVTSLDGMEHEHRLLNHNLPDGDIIYRVSWTSAKEGEETSSTGNINIDITGTGGDQTGDMLIVTHPGMVCNGDDSPRCHTDALGNIPTQESKGSAKCGCTPNDPEYTEEDAKWEKKPGMHQSVYVVGKDVGEIGAVKITSDASELWDMRGMKINTNSQMTGQGAGVFYVHACKINSEFPVEAELAATTSDGEDMAAKNTGETCAKASDCQSNSCDTANEYSCEGKCLSDSAATSKDATENCPYTEAAIRITRCAASVCEEEMDRRFGL